MRGALGLGHHLLTLGRCLSRAGKQGGEGFMEGGGLEPGPQEPIGFGPEASKEGTRVYDLPWGDPILIFIAVCLLWRSIGCKMSL